MRNEKSILYVAFFALVGLSTLFFWGRKDDITNNIQKRLHMGKYVCLRYSTQLFSMS